jgi:dephospho-CoA kinase
MKNNIIVAVVGMTGAGKSEATQFFIEKKFERVYFGDVTFDEMKRLGLEVTPDNERKVRESLRAQNDMAIYAKKSLPKIQKFYDSKKNVVVESMYSWSEYKFLKEIFGNKFKVLAIVTDRDLRAKRLSTRKIRPLTDAEVTKRDYTEIENIEKGGPIAIADHFVSNNGNMSELKKNVEKYIDSLVKND